MKKQSNEMITTRYSITLIQSKIALTQPHLPILTLALLHFKWLKPQYQAKYYHAYTQFVKKDRLNKVKESFRSCLTTVNPENKLIIKYYNMKKIGQQFHKAIRIRLKKDSNKPKINSLLLVNFLLKNRKKNQALKMYRQRVNPEMIHNLKVVANKELRLKLNSKCSKQKNTNKLIPKSQRSNKSKQKLKLNRNLIGVKSAKLTNKQQNYGLKCFKSKSKGIQIHKSIATPIQRQRQGSKLKSIKGHNYYFSNIPSDYIDRKKSITPHKSINSSRKIPSKQQSRLNSSKKTKTLGNQMCEGKLRFGKNDYY